MKGKKFLAVLIVASLTAAVVVSAQTTRYDPVLASLAENRLDGAKVISIWPNDPDLAKMMSRAPDNEKIYMTFHCPVRKRALNGEDLRSHQTTALASLAELLESAIKDYHISASFEILDNNSPGDKTKVSKDVLIRTTDKIMKNVRREGEILYSGELPDGSRLYSGSLLFSLGKDEITKAVSESQNETSSDENKTENDSINDMRRRLKLINSILEQMPSLDETNSHLLSD